MKFIALLQKHLLQIVSVIFLSQLLLTGIGISKVVNYSQLKKILSDKSYVSLDLKQIKLRQGTKSLLELSDETYNHDNGVYAMTHNTASLPYGDLPQSYSFGTSKLKVLDFKTHFSTQSESHQIALGFLQRQFPNFLTKGQPVLIVKSPEEAPASLPGTWEFKWEILDDESLVVFDAAVYVRAMDGKIVSYTTHQYDNPSHKFPANKAKEKVLSMAKENSDLTNIRVTGTLIFPAAEMFLFKNLPSTVYRINLQATNLDNTETYGTHVTVDADTGDILKIDPYTGAPQKEAFQWNTIASAHKITLQSNDFMPTWTKEGLVFMSDRRLKNAPSWLDTKGQIMIKTHDGVIKYITSDLIDTPFYLSGLPNSSWIGIQRSGWTYAFDLQTSEYRVLGNPLRPAQTPAIESGGAEAVISGYSNTAKSGEDIDLMVDNLNRPAPLALRTRLQQNGNDTLSIFSLDGKFLYYISARKESNDFIYSLKVMDTTFKETNEPHLLAPQKQETIIKKLSSEPKRLSLFPDGKRLLVQSESGVNVIDLSNRKMSEVKVNKLQDKELGLVIGSIRDSCAGPTNNSFTFSGKTTDNSGGIKWRIYSCELNGNIIKPLTPISSNAVESYTFPASQKTAFEISKKLALHEVSWVNDHPLH